MRLHLSAAVAALTLGLTPAFADKADDTLRLAFEYPMSTVNAYDDYKPEMEMLSQVVFDSLVVYDERTSDFHPLLATGWEQVDETTWRFTLRDDVTWHDGEPFTADDVVYTFNWIIAPETQIRTKGDFRWLNEAVKIDDYTVELRTNGLTANILSLLAYGAHILPEHIHAPLENKADFRKSLIGTGMYKVASLTDDGLLTLTRNDDWALAAEYWPAPEIGTVQIRSVPDIGAQTAALMSGDIDVVRNARFEEAQAISAAPDYDMTLSQAISYIYMMLDTTGQGGAEALTDPRVRRALMMAVDRDTLQRARVGGQEPSRWIDHMCWDFQDSCAYNEPLPAYDPEGARALLEEAGFGDSLSVSIHTFTSISDYAEMVAGYFDRIGVKAEVIAQTFAAYRKSQADGEFQVFVGAWNGGKAPDAVMAIQQFYNSDARDLMKDPEVTAINRSLADTPMGEERAAKVAQILDASVEQSYLIPISGIPTVFLHNAEVEIEGNRNLAYSVYLNDFSWAD